jgi:uncharacterized protein YndB with AHSA1/START domain
MTQVAASREGGTSVAWDGGELVLTRVFAAPRALVFRMWTEVEHFGAWFGPHGSTMPVCRLDARPGGAIHFCHRFRAGEHPDVWIGGRYRQVAAPERLAFDAWFSDPAGNRVPRPGFPDQMAIAVTFAEHGEGTLVTARHAGLHADQGEVQGWTESLDRLATRLADVHTFTGE